MAASAIRGELKQRKRFRSPGEETAVSILRTADVIRGDLERAMAESDLTLQQYNVLRILRGSHPNPLPTLEIAQRMIERAPGITRLMDRLESTGKVTRAHPREDRRQVLCSITPKGLAALEKADAPLLAAENRRVMRLSRAERADLMALLDRLREESS